MHEIQFDDVAPTAMIATMRMTSLSESINAGGPKIVFIPV
jgi:hypothetical protein